jgi:TolA-binding protein
LRFERKDYGKAKEILEPLATSNAPEREKAMYRLAWTHHMLEDGPATARAYEAFAKAFPRSPLLPEVALLAAKAYLKDGDTTKAAAIFRGVVERGGDDGQMEIALVSLGVCLAQDREFTEAAKRFEDLLARYPKSTLAYRARFGAGWSAENLGKLDDAVAKYRAVAAETKTATGARAAVPDRPVPRDAEAVQGRHRRVPPGPRQLPVRRVVREGAPPGRGVLRGRRGRGERAQVLRRGVHLLPDRDEAKLAKERLAKL